jgi:hypothetical protein
MLDCFFNRDAFRVEHKLRPQLGWGEESRNEQDLDGHQSPSTGEPSVFTGEFTDRSIQSSGDNLK